LELHGVKVLPKWACS